MNHHTVVFLFLSSSFHFLQKSLIHSFLTKVPHQHSSIIKISVTVKQQQQHELKKIYNLKNKNNSKLFASNYQRLTESSTTEEKDPRPFPKIGDIVRYYELDGGKADGQIFVGKISFIQQRNRVNDTPEYLVDVAELDDLGTGYYTEYSGRKRQSKRSTQKLEYIAPIRASYVQSEDAFKVPLDTQGNPMPYVESYNVEDYLGPIPIEVDEELVQSDAEKYNELKSQLLRDTALTGLLGVLLAQLFKGTEDAVIYAVGAFASLGYLYFLSVKTDTVASPSAKLGSNVSNVRFVLPVLVLVFVALRNTFLSSPATIDNNDFLVQPFTAVTSEQFASAMIGFLTYRIPLFTRQIATSLDVGTMLPGSAAIAYQASKEIKEKKKNLNKISSTTGQQQQRMIFLISGPLSAGKTTLVNRLLDEDKRFIKPNVMDRVSDGAKFEILLKQDAILSFLGEEEGGKAGIVQTSSENNNRYVLTEDSLLNSFQKESKNNDTVNKVVLVDATVELTQKLLPIATKNNIIVIGVWVSLDSMDKFEVRLKSQIAIEESTETIPEDETPDSLLRGRTRNVIRDIEYGIVSGVFDFTILNDDLEDSLKQLKDAAEYCFK